MDILSKFQLKKNPINAIEESGVEPHMLLWPVGSLARSFGQGVWPQCGRRGGPSWFTNVEKREEKEGTTHTKLTLDLLRLLKNQRDNLQQIPAKLGPKY